jgi:hypothetical protein
VPEDGLRSILVVDALPLAEDGDCAGPTGDRLALPGAGELGLGRGQDLVALSEELEEGGGEEVLKGKAGGVDRIPRAAHGLILRAGSRGRQSSRLCRPRLLGAGGASSLIGSIPELGENKT